MSSEWDEHFCECYHNPREWDKTHAENIWETFLFWPILGHPKDEDEQNLRAGLARGNHAAHCTWDG